MASTPTPEPGRRDAADDDLPPLSTPRIDRFVGDYRFLSNFFPREVTSDTGHTYASVEHAYQAAKATTEENRIVIAAATSPKKAKRRGAKLPPPPDWEGRKVEIMRRLIRRKFAPGTELAAKLVETKDAELVEGNDWGDTFWGRCDGVGENHLGRLLMETRADLRGASSPDDRTA